MRSLLILCLLASALSAQEKPFPPYTKPTLIAHRGASYDAPEHTKAAYELAIQYGADFVEPDLQLTKDGVLVCLHDGTLERTTDVAKVFPDRFKEVKGKKTWPVADFTWDEIQRLDAGSWKDAKFAGLKVLSFQQMIDLVKGKAGIYPETKNPAESTKRGLNMEKAVMDTLKMNGLDQPGADPKTPVVIQSFSAESLKSLRKDHGCKLPLVYLIWSGGENLTTAEGLKSIKEYADGVGMNKTLVMKRPEMVKDAHALGLSFTVGTFRTGSTDKFKTVKEEMAYFLKELKVDALFTDQADQFPR
jgi:glycerophosphoryl diester phosphodiesterase